MHPHTQTNVNMLSVCGTNLLVNGSVSDIYENTLRDNYFEELSQCRDNFSGHSRLSEMALFSREHWNPAISVVRFPIKLP